jgi:hypothetical protein
LASFSDVADQVYGNQRAAIPQIPNSPSIDNRKQKSNDKPQDNEKSKLKPQYTTFKYCCHGKEYLKEAILLSGRPIFLRYENSQFKTSDKIDESSRILKPPVYSDHLLTARTKM